MWKYQVFIHLKSKIKQNTLGSPRKRSLSLDTNTNKLRRSPRKKLSLEIEKTLEDAKESYNSKVAFEIDQRKIMVPHAIEPSTTSCESCDKYLAGVQILISKIEMLNSENAELKNINENLKIINSDISMRIFSYENISKDEDKFKSFTGLKVCKFNILCYYLDPGDNCENIKFYDKNLTKTEEKVPTNPFSSPSLFSSVSKPGPKPKMKAIHQLFMFLTWLRLGFTLGLTAWLFNMPKSAISRYLITWSNFLYVKLGCIPIWPSKDECIAPMPQIFKETYPSTRVIIDCTELFCQRPSSLTMQSSLFSHYKHHVTYKGLVGIAPSGGITFISELYDGSISDVEIVQRCGILKRSCGMNQIH